MFPYDVKLKKTEENKKKTKRKQKETQTANGELASLAFGGVLLNEPIPQFSVLLPLGLAWAVYHKCHIANGDTNELGHVSEAVLARYMKSVEHWKGNNPWLSKYKEHFVEMRNRGITFEAAQAHLKAGNVTWYLSMNEASRA